MAIVRGRTHPPPPTPVTGVLSRSDRSAKDGHRRAATAPISPAKTLVTADPRPAGENEKNREQEKKQLALH